MRSGPRRESWATVTGEKNPAEKPMDPAGASVNIEKNIENGDRNSWLMLIDVDWCCFTHEKTVIFQFFWCKRLPEATSPDTEIPLIILADEGYPPLKHPGTLSVGEIHQIWSLLFMTFASFLQIHSIIVWLTLW